MNAMPRRRSVLLLVFVGAAACGGSSSPPSSSDPGKSGERINGSERLGWNQTAADAGELATFRYAAYVDGNRTELADVRCTPSGGAFQCSSRMPSMAPGTHTLELATFAQRDGAFAESGRSAPLTVTLEAVTAPADPNAARASATDQLTADGTQLSMTLLAEGLESPTALAFASDGRAVLAERHGRIRIFDPENLTRVRHLDAVEPALDLQDVMVIAGRAGGVLDVALDPDFMRTRLAYVLYTSAAADGSPAFTLARYREAGGRFGERAVILDDVPASPVRPAGAIAIGADGKLYVAFDAAGDPGQADRRASYNGKVLRLEPGGATPPDQPGGSPHFASGLYSPRGFDWHPTSGALWLADITPAEAEELRVWTGAPSRTRVVALPPRTGTAAMAFYRGRLLPAFQGDMLLAAEEGHLLRLRFDRRDSARLVAAERLFDDLDGPVTLVTVDPDGAIYVGTERALFRIGMR